MENNREMDRLEDEKMKQMPFNVPDNYFEELEDRLREKINPKEKSGWWPSFVKILKPAAGLAAAFLLIAGFGWGVMKLTGSTGNKIALNTEYEEEGTMLDTLVREFSTIDASRLYADYIENPEDDLDLDYSEDPDALEEYITLMAPSFPGLLAEELSNK